MGGTVGSRPSVGSRLPGGRQNIVFEISTLDCRSRADRGQHFVQHLTRARQRTACPARPRPMPGASPRIRTGAASMPSDKHGVASGRFEGAAVELIHRGAQFGDGGSACRHRPCGVYGVISAPELGTGAWASGVLAAGSGTVRAPAARARRRCAPPEALAAFAANTASAIVHVDRQPRARRRAARVRHPGRRAAVSEALMPL
jgi:hypothetical protein